MKSIVNLIHGMVLMALSGLVLAGPVNINTADAPTIEKELNGIGAKKAEAIVAYRAANGNFTSADELTKIKGIGSKIVDKNRDNILVSQPKAAGK